MGPYMKVDEGPFFGALIVGGGVGYLLYEKTQNAALGLGVGIAIIVASYVVETLIKTFLGKRK